MTEEAQARINQMAEVAEKLPTYRRIEITYTPKGGALETGVWIARSLTPAHASAGIANENDGPRKALDNLLRSMGDADEPFLDAADLRYIVGSGASPTGLDSWEIKLIHMPTGIYEERTSDQGWRSQLQAKADAVVALTRRVREHIQGQ